MKRLRNEGGYSLIELVGVCALLGIVLAGVTSIMVGGSNAESKLNLRFQSQMDARTALTVFRNDAHTACTATVTAAKTQVTFAIPIVDRTTNPFTAPSPTTQCGATTPVKNIAKVIWCIVTSPTNTTRFALYRSTVSPCNSSGKFQADNLVTTLSNPFLGFFQTAATIPTGQLQTVKVDIPVKLQTTGSAVPYDLNQTVTLRNTVWATTLTAAEGTPCATVACTVGLCTLALCYPPKIS